MKRTGMIENFINLIKKYEKYGKDRQYKKSLKVIKEALDIIEIGNEERN